VDRRARVISKPHLADRRISLHRLAAAYGFALARGHCFPDGIKRVALAIIDVFLRMNGLQLTAEEPETVDTIQLLAAGDLSEDQLVDWITANSTALD
jgi:death-on-curing protein